MLSLSEITEKYRILGLPFSASLDDLRRQRNKLVNKFHPDKFPQGWKLDSISPEVRTNLIQSAYRFILNNFEEIQETLSQMPETCLTRRGNVSSRSHWVYLEVKSYDKDCTEIIPKK